MASRPKFGTAAEARAKDANLYNSNSLGELGEWMDKKGSDVKGAARWRPQSPCGRPFHDVTREYGHFEST
jgi:hypothetical protein